jgi:hypothetical protein
MKTRTVSVRTGPEVRHPATTPAKLTIAKGYKTKQRERQGKRAAEDFVGRFLAGAEVTGIDLQDLLNAGAPEGLQNDFKAGAWVVRDPDGDYGQDHPDTFQGKVCKHVAGFANGTGGVLVIGVAEGKDGTRDNGKPEGACQTSHGAAGS